MISVDCWLKGNRPAFCALTPTPARLWVCSTQPASSRTAWMQLWIVNPAGLTGNADSRSLLPSRSINTRLEAVISSNISP